MLLVVSSSTQESRTALPVELLIFGSPDGAKAGVAMGVMPIIFLVDVFSAQAAAKNIRATSEMGIRFLLFIVTSY